MKLRVLIFFAVFFTLLAISYSLVAPLCPLEAHDRGISIATMGLIVSSYSIMYIGATIICERSQSKIENTTGLKIGMILTLMQIFGLGAAKYVDSRSGFVALSLLVQSIGGIGAGISSTFGFKILRNISPQKLETYNSTLEYCAGVGLIFGSLIASAF